MAVYGYARVSTPRQNIAPQVKALRAAGIPKDRIFQDKSTGRIVDRPGLNALLSAIQPGDTVTCWKVDRLGRSFLECAQIAARLRADYDAHITTITGGVDTRTTEGRFLFSALLAVAELETELRAERQGWKTHARSASRPGVRASVVVADQH